MSACRDCGSKKPSSRHAFCAGCAKARHVSSVAKWTEKNTEKMRTWRRSYYREKKVHIAKRTKAWREANSDRERERQRKLAEKNPGRQSAYTRKSKYGIDRKQFEAMVASQGGKCAICQATSPGARGHAWHVDHDHRFDSRDPAGHRGLLCHACNIGLGAFRDSIGVLQDAIEYLAGHLMQLKRAA